MADSRLKAGARFAGFQVDNNKAFEQVVVEHQIHIKMAGFGADAHLSDDKRKTLAQFEEEFLQLINNGLFQLPNSPLLFRTLMEIIIACFSSSITALTADRALPRACSRMFFISP